MTLRSESSRLGAAVETLGERVQCAEAERDRAVASEQEARNELVTVLEATQRLEAERDQARRLFNRLEAAISHHKKVTDQLFADTHDEALYAARGRILKDSAEGKA